MPSNYGSSILASTLARRPGVHASPAAPIDLGTEKPLIYEDKNRIEVSGTLDKDGAY